MTASCGFLENELRQYSKEEGVTMTDSVETLAVDLGTRVKKLGAKEQALRKKCKLRFSIIKKKKAFRSRLGSSTHSVFYTSILFSHGHYYR